MIEFISVQYKINIGVDSQKKEEKMKVTKRLLNRCYAFLMAFVMVIGLSAAPVLTANAEESEEVVEVNGDFAWYNDDYFGSYEEAEEALADVTAENQAADMADNFLSDSGEVVDVPTFKDTSSAADYLRKCMVERRSTLKFVYKFDKIYYTESYGKMIAGNAWDEIFDKAVQETPNGNEGDYLKWNTGSVNANYTGKTYTDTVTFTITNSFYTTAAQEAAVTNKINTLLDTDFDGWENHTDTTNAYDVFWWLIDNVDIATTSNTADLTSYAAMINGKSLSTGYATSAYRLLKEMGVANRVVKNYNDDNYNFWNIVNINGKYYNMDAFYGEVTDLFFGGLTAEDYLLVSDDFIWDMDYDYRSNFAKYISTEANPYSTAMHNKDTDYDNTTFNAKYPMATEDYLVFTPSAEDAVVVTNPAVSVSYRTHVQREGWQAWKNNGAMSGTSGKGLRLEGIEIKLSGNTGLDLGIEYKTHIQSYGWESEWKANGAMSGTKGEAKRLEAIMIRLTGADAAKYDVYYRVHAQSYGWLGWAKNGQEAGTAGQAKRLEGIEIKIVKKGEVPSGIIGYSYIEYGKKAELNSNVTGMVNYRTHVQSYGWQGYVYDGSLSGTYGEAKRLEGIEISLGDTGYTGGITYRTHIQKIGWQDWKSNGAMSGTSGKALRLEAIEIKLTGELANHYDVYYRVHAQSYGWLDWAKNGQTSGTAGYGKRLESIQIVLLPKGSPAPGATTRPYVVK